jgi:hypothetical protein
MNVWDVLFCVVLPGLVGGLYNAWLMHTRFYFPRIIRDDDRRSSLDPGCFGNIFVGAIAAFLAFSFTIDVQINRWKLAGLCLLVATAGGSFIASLLQKHNLIQSEDKVDAFRSISQQLARLAGSSPKAPPPGDDAANK